MNVLVRDLPQADNFDLVLQAVSAVGRGAASYQSIAEAIGEYNPRQGRYYRLASEILGWTHRTTPNCSSLTPSGQHLVKAGGLDTERLAAEGVLACPIIQRALSFIEACGPAGTTTRQLGAFLARVTRKEGSTTPSRRASTVASWLQRIGVVVKSEGRWVVKGLPPGVEAVQVASDAEPIAPRSFDLQEYRSVAKRTRRILSTIRILVDEKKRERALLAHQNLIRLVASRIRSSGGIPWFNSYVDLAARINDAFFIFEVKSTTRANAHAQARRGLAQLYEYRYAMERPEAELVLVLENPLPSSLGWLTDYLIADRRILLAWNGKGETLGVPQELTAVLSFLATG